MFLVVCADFSWPLTGRRRLADDRHRYGRRPYNVASGSEDLGARSDACVYVYKLIMGRLFAVIFS